MYLKSAPDDEIHYFSIVNSLMIVLFLTGVVGMIILRTLRQDISTYNSMQTLEEAQEEYGWKLVHGDVFRPPASSPLLLSCLAGLRFLSSVTNISLIIYVSFRIRCTTISYDLLRVVLCFDWSTFTCQSR